MPKGSLEPCLFQAEQSPSQSLTGYDLHPSDNLHGLLWPHSSRSLSFLHCNYRTPFSCPEHHYRCLSVTACACGTIEPFRLENTFNIIKSNSKSSIAASTTKPCPQIPQSENIRLRLALLQGHTQPGKSRLPFQSILHHSTGKCCFSWQKEELRHLCSVSSSWCPWG